MRWVPFGALVCALALVVVSVPKAASAHTAEVLQAMVALGPVSGWRCGNLATYAYDPRQQHPDAILLADAPEQTLTATYPEARVVRSEVSLRGSDAVLWTGSDTGSPTRAYVLTPSVREAVGHPSDRPATCYAHQGGWTLIAEQKLQ